MDYRRAICMNAQESKGCHGLSEGWNCHSRAHFAQSLSGWDSHPDLALEITLFRAEVSKVESAIQRTTVFLEHCNSYSNFLTHILKLLALSEVLLFFVDSVSCSVKKDSGDPSGSAD